MAGKSDLALRKRATQRPREKGRTVYIPQEALEMAGLDPKAELFYRIWVGERGRFIVTMYGER